MTSTGASLIDDELKERCIQRAINESINDNYGGSFNISERFGEVINEFEPEAVEDFRLLITIYPYHKDKHELGSI